MLNIVDISLNKANEQLLSDGTWQNAISCELSTDSQFINRASLTILPKQFTNSRSTALIYLLQKEAKSLGLWDKTFGESAPTIKEFISAVLYWGRFTNTTGNVMGTDEFWKSYQNTIEAITSEPSFEYTEEGLAEQFTQKFSAEDIRDVICFDNTWNEKNFLIETSTHWILFNWGTMV